MFDYPFDLATIRNTVPVELAKSEKARRDALEAAEEMELPYWPISYPGQVERVAGSDFYRDSFTDGQSIADATVGQQASLGH